MGATLVSMTSSRRGSGSGWAPRSTTGSSSSLGRRLTLTAIHGKSSRKGKIYVTSIGPKLQVVMRK